MDRVERRKRQEELVLSLYRERLDFPDEWVALMRPCGILRGVIFDAWFSANWREPGFAENYRDDDIGEDTYWQRGTEAMEAWLEGR